MCWRDRLLLKMKYLLMIVVTIGVALFLLNLCCTEYPKWEQHNAIVNSQNTEKQIIDGWYNRFHPGLDKNTYPLYKTKLQPGEEANWLNANQKMVHINESSIRILVLGDSFVWGDGYENSADLWWKKLNVELNNRGYDNIDIYAVGQCGSSTEDELFWLTQTSMLDEIKPDLIIIGYVFNDAQRLSRQYDAKGNLLNEYFHVPIDDSNLYYAKIIKALFPNWGYLFENMINSKINSYRNYNDKTGYPSTVWPRKTVEGEELRKYISEVISPLGAFCKDIPLFVVSLPYCADLEQQKDVFNIVSPVFQQNNIKFYDMYDELFEKLIRSSDIKDLKINPINDHPGRKLTTYYAKYVADILEKDFSDIVGTPNDKMESTEILVDEGRPWSVYPVMTENHIIEFTYPAMDEQGGAQLQFMPVKEDYIRISFVYPVCLSKIKIQDSIKNAKLWVTSISKEKGYDDGAMHLLREKDNAWDAKNELVTSICLHLDNENGEKLQMELFQ